MGSRCAKCGEPTDPWVDGDGGDERCRCTPTPPAAAANRTTPPVEGTSGQGGAAVTDAGFDSPGGSARAAVASGAEMREACAKACLSRAELLREKSADFLKRAGGSHGLTEARECREAAERRLQDALLCESLAASLRALPLPADDAETDAKIDAILADRADADLLRECAKRDREEHCRGASGPADARAHLKWAKELVRSLSDRDGAVLSLDADEWEDIKAFLALPLPRDASGEMREACADLADDMVQAECDRLLAEAQLLHKNRHWNDDDPGRNSRVSQKAVEGLCGKIGAAIRALPLPGDDAVEEASRG